MYLITKFVSWDAEGDTPSSIVHRCSASLWVLLCIPVVRVYSFLSSCLLLCVGTYLISSLARHGHRSHLLTQIALKNPDAAIAMCIKGYI